MIYYNTIHKIYIELQFNELASYGFYMFIAGIINNIFTNIELENNEHFEIFNIIFNNFNIKKYNEMELKIISQKN